MLPEALRDRLTSVPDASVATSPNVLDAIDESARYLASEAAHHQLAIDTYWPKWNAPWWHMLLLFELGDAHRIPNAIAGAMVAALDAMPLKTFPFRPEDIPPGVDPHRHTFCHCALGSICQVLEATGIDVDRTLPWLRPWFVRYQMADGGLSCDGEAYTISTECPSSMVGTVAAFEAMLHGDPTTWSPEHARFVSRAASFLAQRKAKLGSSSTFNAEERTREHSWQDLCFPRFYFYDVLRGLSALVRWTELTEAKLSLASIEEVTTALCDRFPDGVVIVGRHAYEGVRTRALNAHGEWERQDASMFSLLEATSVIGQPSPRLTRLWSQTRAGLLRAIEAGRIQ